MSDIDIGALATLSDPLDPQAPPWWDVVLKNPDTPEVQLREFAITDWISVNVTYNFDGITAEIQVPTQDPAMRFMRILVSDILLSRNRVLQCRLRIVDVKDTFTAEDHIVTITAQDYGQLLARRVLFDDKNYEDDAAHPGGWDQFDIVRNLVNYTQNFQTLGITFHTTGDSGRKVVGDLQRGQSIRDAINAIARVENGFDWWVDEDLKMWMQRPRRARNLWVNTIMSQRMTWKWGVQVRELQCDSAASEYASVVMVLGATAATQIGNRKPIPPPDPAIVRASSLGIATPFGRWERTYSFSDVIRHDGLVAKAKHILKDLTSLRCTYSITTEPGAWGSQYAPTVGDIFDLVVESPNRTNVHDVVRVEELKIALTPDGEVVTLALRAEIEQPPVPLLLAAPLAAQPDGEITIDLDTVEHGATVATSHLSVTEQVARIMGGLEERTGVLERTGRIGADEVQVSADEPTNPGIELWYDTDA